MPVKSVTTDYTSRKRDISILQTPDARISGEQTVQPSFGYTGKFCAGVQKLIQRYAITLLTDIESQENYPNFGTNFLYSLNRYSFVDAVRVQQLFTLANYAAVNTLQVYQNSQIDMPADEKIVSAKLQNIVISRGSASFSIAITTETGSVVDFLLPLPE
jgi:hypothetical protein